MKRPIGVLVFIIAIAGTGFASECTPEAQFAGTVKNFSAVQKSESLVECTYQIKFSHFSPSVVCPLLLEDTIEYQFIDADCSRQNGEELSGVLAKHGLFIVIDE